MITIRKHKPTFKRIGNVTKYYQLKGYKVWSFFIKSEVTPPYEDFILDKCKSRGIDKAEIVYNVSAQCDVISKERVLNIYIK